MMNMEQKLRAFAINDLKRFCDPLHYLGRDRVPEADRLLAKPLVERFASLGLTPREFDAATALDAFATYQIRSRAIWDKAYPGKDSDDRSESPGTTEHQDTEIRERLRMFREAALVYARTLNDCQLIEAFQSAELPAVTAKETSEERDTRIFNRCNALRNAGVKAWQQQVAGEEGLSASRIKNFLERHKSKMQDADPPSLSMLGQLKAAQGK